MGRHFMSSSLDSLTNRHALHPFVLANAQDWTSSAPPKSPNCIPGADYTA